MKVALVHEFLTQYGGAERVLEAFLELFPQSPVYTLVHDPERTKGVFNKYEVRTSFLQRIPGLINNYKWALAMMPRAIESFDLRDYDLVLSDSSAFAKGVKTKNSTLHICYCHTPTRYLWESRDEYVQNLPYSRVLKMFAKVYLKRLIRWDYRAAQRPDYFLANSQTVKGRIKKYYDRDAEVIYPPVDTRFFHPAAGKSDYFFTLSRLEPYKKIDLVVEAFAKLGLPLKVAGEGTQLEQLKIMNQESGIRNIEFLGKVSDEELRKLYSEARAFVFPAVEDAGIVVLEALACGTPVIGLGQAGTAEFIEHKKNGVLFPEQTVNSIIEAVKEFQFLRFDRIEVRQSAVRFDKEEFKRRVFDFINDKK